MVRPTNELDIFEQYDQDSTKGVKNFLLWVVGNIPENARLVSKPTLEVLNLNKNKSNPVIPEYVNALNNNLTNNNPGQTPDANGNGDVPNKTFIQQQIVRESSPQVEEIGDESWLEVLMKRSSKLGQEDRFKHTILNVNNSQSSDVSIIGPTPYELESKLPINLKNFNDESVFVDDLNGDEYES